MTFVQTITLLLTMNIYFRFWEDLTSAMVAGRQMSSVTVAPTWVRNAFYCCCVNGSCQTASAQLTYRSVNVGIDMKIKIDKGRR